ncbi:TIGR01459 family HAD-type hydrolase [Bosea sp. 124]|uniref:TIGR01459 family HAD-type hydrolase n=1 Tax=Bosea sp. 124 TaxID=2135642 RepID=UPI000D3880C0|nr:TIGR01459 family HAD-type hydrolase [Bosea sp. 124]PTM39997.1 HAD superfamily hydrolase (TIGR01459 family) [Bosea sp. 124]
MPALPTPGHRRTATTFIDGLSAVAERYRGFLVDQWGVLHDGVRPYPDALECLIGLRECGKPVIILSNSGRSGAANERILASLGFPRDLYECVVSAGDDAREAIAAAEEPFYRDLGRRCLLLARESDRDLGDGLGLDLVDRPRDADFLLLMSMEPPHQSLTGWLPLLEASLAAGLPMICGNPDVQRTRGDGTLQKAPGFVAKAYAGMGGVVRYHGKPEPRIYQSCLSRLGLAPSEVLCIGDSLAHDVAGSQGVGLQSAFIAGGIHQHDLAWQTTDKVDPHSCLALFDRHQMHPEFALGHLRW